MRSSWTDERLDDGFDRVSADIALLRNELHEEVGSLRRELHEEVGSLRRELHEEVGSLRGETKSLWEETMSLRGETQSLRGETKLIWEEIRSLRKEMHQGFASLHRALFQVAGGIIVALLGIIATQL